MTGWKRSSRCNGASACVETRWVRSSRCNQNGNCVDLAWVAAVTCNNGSCVEIARSDGEVWVRDSKLGDSPVLKFQSDEWLAFLAAINARQLDGYGGPVLFVPVGRGWRMWRDGEPGVVLFFDDAEVEAFVEGARAGEFTPEALAAPSAPLSATETREDVPEVLVKDGPPFVALRGSQQLDTPLTSSQNDQELDNQNEES